MSRVVCLRVKLPIKKWKLSGQYTKAQHIGLARVLELGTGKAVPLFEAELKGFQTGPDRSVAIFVIVILFLLTSLSPAY